jgi:hypothetical protein
VRTVSGCLKGIGLKENSAEHVKEEKLSEDVK